MKTNIFYISNIGQVFFYRKVIFFLLSTGSKVELLLSELSSPILTKLSLFYMKLNNVNVMNLSANESNRKTKTNKETIEVLSGRVSYADANKWIERYTYSFKQLTYNKNVFIYNSYTIPALIFKEDTININNSVFGVENSNLSGQLSFENISSNDYENTNIFSGNESVIYPSDPVFIKFFKNIFSFLDVFISQIKGILTFKPCIKPRLYFLIKMTFGRLLFLITKFILQKNNTLKFRQCLNAGHKFKTILGQIAIDSNILFQKNIYREYLKSEIVDNYSTNKIICYVFHPKEKCLSTILWVLKEYINRRISIVIFSIDPILNHCKESCHNIDFYTYNSSSAIKLKERLNNINVEFKFEPISQKNKFVSFKGSII
jgi:hypothetical protein